MNRRHLLLAAFGATSAVSLGNVSIAAEVEPPILHQLNSSLTRDELHRRYSTALARFADDAQQDKLSKLIALLGPFDTQRMRNSFAEMERDIPKIFASSAEFTAPFLWSLEKTLAVLEAFLDRLMPERRRTLALTNAVASARVDLSCKAMLLTRGAQPPRDRVEITVKTSRDDVVVEGCTIFCSPHAQVGADQIARFSGALSPSTGLIPAGHWWIWSSLEGKVGPRVELPQGTLFAQKQTIEIPAPL